MTRLLPIEWLGAGPVTIRRALRRTGGLHILGFGLTAAIAVAFLFPIYWMVVNAFQEGQATQRIPPEFFPSRPTLQNFVTIFDIGGARWIVNSAIVATGGMVLGVGLSLLAGYAFGKKRFPGRSLLFGIVLTMMMIPGAVTLIPLFLTMRDLHLVNTHLGMFLPAAAWPFGIFFARQYMASIPDALIEAARVDGAGEVAVFWRIIVPLARPAIGALAILAFVGAWGNYLWQLVMANDEDMYTVLIGAASRAKGSSHTDWGLIMAGSTIAFLPMFVLFMRFQSSFLKGIYVGSLKE